LPTLTVQDSHECADEVLYALRNRQSSDDDGKDTVEICWFWSPTGRVFQMDGPTAAKLRGPKQTFLVAGTTRS